MSLYFLLQQIYSASIIYLSRKKAHTIKDLSSHSVPGALNNVKNWGEK